MNSKQSGRASLQTRRRTALHVRRWIPRPSAAPSDMKYRVSRMRNASAPNFLEDLQRLAESGAIEPVALLEMAAHLTDLAAEAEAETIDLREAEDAELAIDDEEDAAGFRAARERTIANLRAAKEASLRQEAAGRRLRMAYDQEIARLEGRALPPHHARKPLADARRTA